MIPTLTLCSLDRFRGMVDVYNYIIRVVNILAFIYSILCVAGSIVSFLEDASLSCSVLGELVIS